MTTEEISFPERVFQLWGYTVGMGRLLLRSTKSPTYSTRIDVLIQNVQFVKMPAYLEGLAIRVANESERMMVEVEVGALPSGDVKCFVVSGSSYTGYVIAGALKTYEDEGSYSDPSPLLTW